MEPSSNIFALDQDLCMGSGYCARQYPELFSMGDDGIAELQSAGSDDDDVVAAAQDAASFCPASAIDVTAVQKNQA